MTMKKNELMLGDWVLYDMNYGNEDISARPNYQPTFIQNGDDIDFAEDMNCIGDERVYLPMPLTKEIMEINGFKCGIFPAWHTNIIDDNKSLSAMYHEGSETIFIAIKEPNFKLENACILYVHELQHLLRLCRIEKQIEVYKS